MRRDVSLAVKVVPLNPRPFNCRPVYLHSIPTCHRTRAVPAERSAYPCLSGACAGCTDQSAGSSCLSAAAAAAVACTLSGAWCAGA